MTGALAQLRFVFATLAVWRDADGRVGIFQSVIVFVDLEHERFRRQPDRWERSVAQRRQTCERLEALAEQPCQVVPYASASPGRMKDLRARAVLISGCHTDFEHYAEADLEGLRAIYREAAWPVLGLCAGFQLMAQTWGARLGPLGRLAPDEADPYDGQYTPGMRQERGFMPVQVGAPHALFDGLPQRPVFFQAHYWEVKPPAPGFEALAASALCRLQAAAHDRLPLFGTQFHPELYDDDHPDGRRLLLNFFRLAGVVAEPERRTQEMP